MKKSFFLVSLRFFFFVAILIFLAMIYWSNQIQEGKWLDLEARVKRLESKGVAISKQQELLSFKKKEVIAGNLLIDDPYFQTTLPKLLPPHFHPRGVRRQAIVGTKPESLHPFSNWAYLRDILSFCTASLANNQVGVYESMTFGAAGSIVEEKEGLVYRVRLRDDLEWAPLTGGQFPKEISLHDQFLHAHKVTSYDCKFYLDVIKNPYVSSPGVVALRGLYQDVDRIEIVDAKEFLVIWKEPKYISRLLTGSIQPLPLFLYTYFPDGQKILEDDSDPDIYQKSPLFAQNFVEHWAKNVIASSGPYLFEEFNDREIRLKRNPAYFNPLQALIEELVFVIKDSPENGWTAFKEGSLDTFEIQPMQLPELETFLQSPLYQSQKKRGEAIYRLPYTSRAYYYVGWNQKNPLFASKEIRRAMTMAIDRKRIIRDICQGQGYEIHGSFYLHSPSTSPIIAPWPFNPRESRKILQEAGWADHDGDGILDKEIDGKPVKFSFTMTYYTKNPTYRFIAEYIKSALMEMGIEVKLYGVDAPELSTAFDDKKFDALLMGWAFASPPEDPRQLWYSTGASERGSSNMVSFQNRDADLVIDKLDREFDPEKRLALYHRFDEIIHEEEPYTFLLTPKATLLYRERVKNLFIPSERKELIPNANIGEPDISQTWVDG